MRFAGAAHGLIRTGQISFETSMRASPLSYNARFRMKMLLEKDTRHILRTKHVIRVLLQDQTPVVVLTYGKLK